MQEKMTTVSTKAIRALVHVSTGNPGTAVEASKFLTGAFERIGAIERELVATFLIELVVNEHAKLWARTMAAYTLGFWEDRRGGQVLLKVLNDPKNSVQLRDHAAEALGVLRFSKALATLAGLAASNKTPRKIKRSAIYALEEIGGSKAEALLEAIRKRRSRRSDR